MTYLSILMLSIVLSIDACIVSFSYGLKQRDNNLKYALLLSSTTGLFQGLMPVIGYYFTNFVKLYIEPYSRLIVIVIFSYLGIKFIIEAFGDKNDKKVCIDVLSLILIGIATSIDAFSAGITLSIFGNKILKPAILIGLVTFINANAGFYIGSRIRHMPVKQIEIIAGLILIIMGVFLK